MTQPINDDIILRVIDKGLSALGDNPKQALWYVLEKDFNFERNKVPSNFETFEETLRSFFGLGYNFLGSLFREHLQEATGENLECYKSFSQCIAYLRNKQAAPK